MICLVPLLEGSLNPKGCLMPVLSPPRVFGLCFRGVSPPRTPRAPRWGPAWGAPPKSVPQHLLERSWYAVTETCLAFTVFRDDFSPRFVALFTLLLFLKCFHWLAEDRVDFVSVVGSGKMTQNQPKTSLKPA